MVFTQNGVSFEQVQNRSKQRIAKWPCEGCEERCAGKMGCTLTRRASVFAFGAFPRWVNWLGSATRGSCLRAADRCHGYFSGPQHQAVSGERTSRPLPPVPPRAKPSTSSTALCTHAPPSDTEAAPLSAHAASRSSTMADDTRQPDEPVARPRGPANVMPGGTAHTAGGEKTDSAGPTYIDAVRSLGPEYYLNFHKRPCVRDSQLQGIAAGFAGGSLAFIVGSMCRPDTRAWPWC